MVTSRARRPIILAMLAAFALLLAFSFVASLAASTASAAETSVRNLVIRSVTLNPQTKVTTVKGAVTCSRGDFLSVDVEVSQTVGRLHTVRARGGKDLDCDGRARFTLRLQNDEGRLGPGDADVDASAFTCNPDNCFGTDLTRVMRITNEK